jgi:DNA-binding NtrC family response regulator
LLIVDDEANTLASLSRAFRLAGHEATVCDNPNRAMEVLRDGHFDLILSDVVMPGKDGLSLLEDIRKEGIGTPVVMMSGQAHIEMAVRATRLGALDFLEKPISTEKLLLTLENALKLSRLESENRELREAVGTGEIVFSGETMQRLMAQVERVASSETRVAILGETGTGKELIARTLHEKSRRASGPFVTLNCAAVPAELIESELFGHEKGAFTGAGARHLGKFEQAQHGTLFLDEIGDMPLPMQAKLLRVLQEHEIERVGGSEVFKIDVRVVAATNRDLIEAAKTGAFRPDLYDRLNVLPLSLPPLRTRREDIRELVQHFLSLASAANDRPGITVSEEALAELTSYSFPGNVRELRNIIERLVILTPDDRIGASDVRTCLGEGAGKEVSGVYRPGVPFRVLSEEAERAILEGALAYHEGHMAQTARALDLERSHLYKKCKALGLRGGRTEEED